MHAAMAKINADADRAQRRVRSIRRNATSSRLRKFRQARLENRIVLHDHLGGISISREPIF